MRRPRSLRKPRAAVMLVPISRRQGRKSSSRRRSSFAKTLEYSPAKIYQYVANEIRFDFITVRQRRAVGTCTRARVAPPITPSLLIGVASASNARPIRARLHQRVRWRRPRGRKASVRDGSERYRPGRQRCCSWTDTTRTAAYFTATAACYSATCGSKRACRTPTTAVAPSTVTIVGSRLMRVSRPTLRQFEELPSSSISNT